MGSNAKPKSKFSQNLNVKFGTQNNVGMGLAFKRRRWLILSSGGFPKTLPLCPQRLLSCSFPLEEYKMPHPSLGKKGRGRMVAGSIGSQETTVRCDG